MRRDDLYHDYVVCWEEGVYIFFCLGCLLMCAWHFWRLVDFGGGKEVEVHGRMLYTYI